MVTSHLRPSGCVAFSTLAFKLAVGTGGCPQHRFGRRRTSQHPWLFELWVPLLPAGWLLLFFFFFFWTFSFQYPSQASSVLTRELELGLEKTEQHKGTAAGASCGERSSAGGISNPWGGGCSFPELILQLRLHAAAPASWEVLLMAKQFLEGGGDS